jgi:hypothetical protein
MGRGEHSHYMHECACTSKLFCKISPSLGLLCTEIPQMNIIIVIFQTAAAAAMCLTITCAMNATYHKCIQDTLTVNCSVNGTRLIWSSEEYIGTGGNNIEYGLIDGTGLIIRSSEYNTTTAELLRVDSINNILESNLNITVSTNGTIMCLDDSRNIQLNTSIIAGK